MSSGLNYYYKRSNIVIICMKLSIASTNTSIVAFTIPSGYRPNNQVNTLGWAGTESKLLSVESNGNVEIRELAGGVVKDVVVSGILVYTV